MVPKKDGGRRPCGDYRRLKHVPSRTGSIPQIQSSTTVEGKTIFSKKIAFSVPTPQIPVRKRIKKTAFITPFGLFSPVPVHEFWGWQRSSKRSKGFNTPFYKTLTSVPLTL
ncbi:hypothetical protein JTE90_000814 [Oedothorax gibbosus]|uniref:Uncharacterized protein n=1 Tax=Oedothorax gibbosus TaxID=931172 RepID=A0AAV6TPI2_9ARAC|nr:hypothetical protein JTE90_000814 [Oedothorax gibbosus]